MIRYALAILLALTLLVAAGCNAGGGTSAQPSDDAQANPAQDASSQAANTAPSSDATPEPNAESTSEPTPEATPEPTPDPNTVYPGCPTIAWTLPETDISVNVPAVWEDNTELVQLLSENPDIERMYVVMFQPEDIELPQEADIGFLCLIRASVWDAANGVVSDTPINEIGRADEYVVGYTGLKDNPFVIDSAEEQLFTQLMLPTTGSAEVLSVN
jgi:hypothetical protein